MDVFVFIKADLSEISIQPEGGFHLGDTVTFAVDDNLIEGATVIEEAPNKHPWIKLLNIPRAERHLAFKLIVGER